MAQSATEKEGFRPKRRRFQKIALGIAILLVVGWFAFEHFVLDVDRYRPMIAQAIERATGLPATIGALDLVLLPSPRLVADTLSVGESDFKVALRQGTVQARIRPLFRRELVIDSIVLDGLAITVPEGTANLSEKVDAIIEKLNSSGGGDSEPWITLSAIETIRAENAGVYLGDADKRIAIITVEVSDAASDQIVVSMSTTLPLHGDPARFESDVVIELDSQSKALSSIKGSGQLEGLQLARALPLEGAPEAELRLTVDVTGVNENDITARLDGALNSANPAVDGAFGTGVHWKDGVLSVVGLSWDAPGVKLSAGGSRNAEGVVALSIRDLSVEEGALDTILDMARYGALRLKARESALLRATNVDVVLGANWYPDFHSGEVRFEGVDAVLDSGEGVSSDIRSEVEIKQGYLLVNEFAGEGFSVAGSILRDKEAGSVAVDVRGHAELNRARLRAFTSTDEVTDIGGTVWVDAFKATFSEQPVVPEDLEVGIRVADGSFGLNTSDFKGHFAPVTAELTGDGMSLATTLHAASAQLGGITLEGRYDVETYQWDGTVAGDLQRIVNTFLPETEKKRLGSILAQYGESSLAAQIDLPSAARDDLTITLEREGEPQLDAAVAYDFGDMELGDVNANAMLDTAKLDKALLGSIVASGPAAITFARSEAQANLLAHVDLTQSTIQVGDYVTKREGDVLAVDVTGEASADRWAVHLIEIDCLGESISMNVGGERVRIDNLDLALASLGPLLSEGQKAHGTLRGTIALDPLEAELRFENAGFSLKPDVGINSIDGSVALGENTIALRRVRVLGPRTDCQVDLERANGVWDGTLTGDKLDLNPIMAVVEEVQALTAGDAHNESVAAETVSDSDVVPLLGAIAIELGEFYYRRGRVDSLGLKAAMNERGIHVSDITMRTFSGSVTGSVFVPAPTNFSEPMDIDLVASEVDIRIIDETLYEEPNMFYGIVSGKVDFRAPIEDGSISMRGANGTIEWDAREGSFGKLGIATKLLTVLKTTQVIALKAPSLRDEGLTYDTCVGVAEFADGNMDTKDTSLRSTAYAMVIEGGADFTTEETAAEIFVRVLESVGGAVRKIPVVGRLTEVTTDHIGVRVKVSGSPYDPDFKVSAATSLVEGVTGIGEGVVDLGADALKGVKDVTTGTLKKILKKD